jgi:hypothetical protein
MEFGVRSDGCGPRFGLSAILSTVLISMTRSAQRDQILIGVPPSLTELLYMVNLQAGSRPTGLTSPPVAPQHVVPQLGVKVGIKSN